MMHTSQQIAKHLKEVFYGGNWTASNLRDTLAETGWQQAVRDVQGCNTIATLLYHTGYYLKPITAVLRGGELDASDKESFDTPAITDTASWQKLIEETFVAADALIAEIEKLPDEDLEKVFGQAKYGSTMRNLLGVIEHTHYHLGQIAILKKLTSY